MSAIVLSDKLQKLINDANATFGRGMDIVVQAYNQAVADGYTPKEAAKILLDNIIAFKRSTIYSFLPSEAKAVTRPKKIPTLESAIDEQKREILVTSNGSSHAAEDEPSRIERLPDQENFTARSLEVAAEEKGKDEQITYLESRNKELEADIANKDYELHQLRSLLKTFKAEGKLFYANQVFPFVAEIDPQARRIVSSEMSELEARRVNAQ